MGAVKKGLLAGGGVAGGLLATPEEAEASHIGRVAKGTRKVFEFAEDLLKRGVDEEEIWKQTWDKFGIGASFDPLDGKWRATYSNFNDYLKIHPKDLKPNKKYKLEDILDSQLIDLYKDNLHYPDLGKIPVEFDFTGKKLGPSYGARRMQVGPKMKVKESIILRHNDDPLELMRVLFHELDHSIQGREGFSPGSSSDIGLQYLDDSLVKSWEMLRRKAWANGVDPNDDPGVKQITQRLKDLRNSYPEHDQNFDRASKIKEYHRALGENYAKITETNVDKPPAALRELGPPSANFRTDFKDINALNPDYLVSPEYVGDEEVNFFRDRNPKKRIVSVDPKPTEGGPGEALAAGGIATGLLAGSNKAGASTADKPKDPTLLMKGHAYLLSKLLELGVLDKPDLKREPAKLFGFGTGLLTGGLDTLNFLIPDTAGTGYNSSFMGPGDVTGKEVSEAIEELRERIKKWALEHGADPVTPELGEWFSP